MLYIIVPHTTSTWENLRIFTSFSAAESAIFIAARGYLKEGHDPDWCYLVAYDGTDELFPVYLYTIVAPDRLRRYPYPNPSP